jgi:hypothetical protein
MGPPLRQGRYFENARLSRKRPEQAVNRASLVLFGSAARASKHDAAAPGEEGGQAGEERGNGQTEQEVQGRMVKPGKKERNTADDRKQEGNHCEQRHWIVSFGVIVRIPCCVRGLRAECEGFVMMG